MNRFNKKKKKQSRFKKQNNEIPSREHWSNSILFYIHLNLKIKFSSL